jgi:hypothetical protein
METTRAYSPCYGTSPRRTGLPPVSYPGAAAGYIFRPMPPSVATWSFWIAACACAVGQVAILRDTVGPLDSADSPSETDLDKSTSPPAVRPRVPGRLHAAGEVIWALLPGVAVALVLLWTWTVMRADARVAVRSDPGVVVATRTAGAVVAR